MEFHKILITMAKGVHSTVREWAVANWLYTNIVFRRLSVYSDHWPFLCIKSAIVAPI